MFWRGGQGLVTQGDVWSPMRKAPKVQSRSPGQGRRQGPRHTPHCGTRVPSSGAPLVEGEPGGWGAGEPGSRRRRRQPGGQQTGGGPGQETRSRGRRSRRGGGWGERHSRGMGNGTAEPSSVRSVGGCLDV